MTEWLDIAKKVTLRHPLFGSIRLSWFEHYAALHLDLSANVVSRDSNELIEVRLESEIAIIPGLEPAKVLELCSRHARQALRHLVCHEVDEMLLVDGVLLFDPHAY